MRDGEGKLLGSKLFQNIRNRGDERLHLLFRAYGDAVVVGDGRLAEVAHQNASALQLQIQRLAADLVGFGKDEVGEGGTFPRLQ